MSARKSLILSSIASKPVALYMFPLSAACSADLADPNILSCSDCMRSSSVCLSLDKLLTPRLTSDNSPSSSLKLNPSSLEKRPACLCLSAIVFCKLVIASASAIVRPPSVSLYVSTSPSNADSKPDILSSSFCLLFLRSARPEDKPARLVLYSEKPDGYN